MLSCAAAVCKSRRRGLAAREPQSTWCRRHPPGTSPARLISWRTRAGHRCAPRAAHATPRGEPTSARSARFMRHFDAKAARRSRASADGPSLVRPTNKSSATATANSAPRMAKCMPSPVIGSMNPAASPASSRPATPAAFVSTAKRTEHRRRQRRAALREALAQQRIGAQRRHEQRRRFCKRTAAWLGTTTHAFVSPPGTGAMPM